MHMKKVKKHWSLVRQPCDNTFCSGLPVQKLSVNMIREEKRERHFRYTVLFSFYFGNQSTGSTDGLISESSFFM